MTSALLPLSVVVPLALLLIAALCRLAETGRLKRNGFAGIRLSSAMASEDAWRHGHRAAERPAWLGFAVAVVAAVVGWVVRSSAAGTVCVVVVCVTFVAAFVWSVAAAVRAARTSAF